MSEDIGRSFTRVGAPTSADCAAEPGCSSDMNNDMLAVAYDAAGLLVSPGLGADTSLQPLPCH